MKGKETKNSPISSHQTLKGQAKNRVQHLQSMFNEFQVARKESRSGDLAKLEEQVIEVLREWKSELDEPTPASSFREESLGSFEHFSSMLQYFDLEDDATSPLPGPSTMSPGNGNELGVTHCAGDKEEFYMKHTPQQHEFQNFQNHVTSHMPQQHDFQGFTNHVPQQHEFQDFGNHSLQHEFQGFEHCNSTPNVQRTVVNDFGASGLNSPNISNQLDYLNSNVHQNFENEVFLSPSDIGQWGLDVSDFSDVLPNVNLQPSAFLGPKCALWDCARPAQGSELCNNYCSSFHAELAKKECPPGTGPVLRPGGIGLKDGPLILALRSKIEGKDVGIPECPGAASTKSPWNAPELFDITILEGEKIREWLFFDKPRRAFETGNRKQRSLPDHEGRGWHESRKLPLTEYGGRKRSYYADPQPQKNFDWHLYEYEVDNCDAYALYRLELKATTEKKSPKVKVAEEKKSPKMKASNDPLLDLQNQMGRLTAVVSTEDKPFGKGKSKDNVQSNTGNVAASSSPSETNVYVP
ncbi:transcription factor VOZ1-like [Silene latifolia]|uniref:transcription factor VOZ1-like n=1 Tax=Silene latifolia TaxID=37657 RepID=UPI003D7763EA